MTTNAQKVVWPALVAVVLIALWQGLVVAFQIPHFLVPSPLRVAQTLFVDAGLLFGALLTTLKITLFAFGCATLLGVLIAFAFVQSRVVETALFPYAVLLQVTPIVAIAPLIIIWVKNPTASLVICATLVALFPIIANTTLGLRSVNPGLMSYFKLNHATRAQTLLRLRIPSALPYFRRLAHQLRPGADRRRRRRIRRRYGRHRHRAGLPDSSSGLSTQHPPHVCRSGADHGDGRVAVRADGGVVEMGARRLA
jgi:ABC-type nitrate/sulfonate/bicarbonate transport system permease component